ncbi:formate dehydrogenase subunit gamma [Sulfitobacter undariae]|uniref:Formate dehydrogenase subunit gamma n=1 Tax=Sulfitobacter undariae TaxID=1563671 RepID=A0A7W6E532_9RHOB|nr:formate dehydrogenase subunit gamma [Sulfitobacter undariae]MBB3994911.1 formate dehydrogenase subunit gamma [Sulfitobacter undariae]
MLRLLAVFALVIGMMAPAYAQDDNGISRAQTGGAQTLDDILKRQDNQRVDDEFRRNATGDPDAGAPTDAPLGTRGGQSDAEMWRGVRFDSADIRSQQRGPAATTLIQDGGMWWLKFREGPLLIYGAALLGGTLLLLAIFYAFRGRIEIEGEKTGRTFTRFSDIERFGHWLLAGSFLVLGITGLISLFGRKVLIPVFGHDAFSALAVVTKWIHNNISWAFMLALIIVFVFWVIHNIPNRKDLVWLMRGGGIFGGGHPPATKFNAGQKIVFWAVIVLGTSISVSGLSLLFPFEFNIFGHTFATLNDFGVMGWVGLDPLPYPLAPQEEMQFAQLWHAVISLVLTAIIFAHIYLGTVGMEGAFDAMGTGEVEETWAREHHSLWVEEIENAKAKQQSKET